MDYKEQIEELRFLSSHVPEQMCDADGKDPLEKAADAIETLLAERDAAIRLLRTPAWCNGCIHFKGLEGCGIGIMGERNEENDHYQFRGAKMEDKEG